MSKTTLENFQKMSFCGLNAPYQSKRALFSQERSHRSFYKTFSGTSLMTFGQKWLFWSKITQIIPNIVFWNRVSISKALPAYYLWTNNLIWLQQGKNSRNHNFSSKNDKMKKNVFKSTHLNISLSKHFQIF